MLEAKLPLFELYFNALLLLKQLKSKNSPSKMKIFLYIL